MFLLYTKMSETTYYQRNWGTILNRAKKDYDNNNEILKKKQKVNIENYLKKRRK